MSHLINRLRGLEYEVPRELWYVVEARAGISRLPAAELRELSGPELTDLRQIAESLGSLAARIQTIERRLDYDQRTGEWGSTHRSTDLTRVEERLRAIDRILRELGEGLAT